ncbi:MAG: hypothetical protein ACYC6W_10835 [Nitrosotalea sp.]
MKKLLAITSILLATAANADVRVVPQHIYCTSGDINSCKALDGNLDGFDKVAVGGVMRGQYDAISFGTPARNRGVTWTVVKYINHTGAGDVFMQIQNIGAWHALLVSGTNWQIQGEVAVCNPLQTNICPLAND